MLAALFLVAILAAAVPLSRKLWALGSAEDEVGPVERFASIGVVALTLAIGIDWVLAFGHLLRRGVLIAVAIALVACGGWAFVRQRRRVPGSPAASAGSWSRRGAIVSLVSLAPVGVWLGYVFWRGTILFVYLSDGLSYHLPKALFLARHHAFGMFEGNDARLTTFPANYELLLADVITLTGTDTLTFAVSILAFLLFGLLVAAMAERWWSTPTDGLAHVAVATLFALALPPVLLAAGAHKNDLLTAAAMLASIHWGARWAVTGQRPALVLAILGGVLAIGTKVNAGVLVLALAPCALWRWRASAREGSVSLGAIAGWLAGGAGALLLLGGGVYVFNLVTIGHPIGASAGAGGYGGWDHLWKFPLLVFLRGFSSGEDVWVPWLGVRWSWPEWDLFFAPFGTPTSVLVLALPVAIWRYRAEGADGRRRERVLGSLAVVIAFLATLPVRVNEPPVGFFIGIGRYALGLPVIVFLWTVAPFVRRLASSARPPVLTAAAVLSASALFTGYAVRCALRDQGARLGFALSVHDGLVPPRAVFTYPERAGQVVDERAAADAVVAFDGAFDSWVYPIFGAGLSRHVAFLHPERGPVTIPANATWVAVDRWWHCGFGDPRFTDFSQWQYYLHGQPEPEDLIVYEQLLADPRFQLVYRSDKTNQAVFVRIAP